MRWGIVATIKAPARDILQFVAHHLEIGATHLFIYLDDDNETAQAALEAHPQVTVTRTDQRFWKANGKNRPAKHQVRQGRNATHAYQRASSLVDWLIHIDVDEFLWPQRPLDGILSDVPAHITSARVRPVEALAPDENSQTNVTYFKRFIPADGRREGISQALFPTFGLYVKGGFLSHVQGKAFIRTGRPDIQIRVHFAFQDGEELSDKIELEDVDLCHLHAPDWDKWLAHYRFRHNRGSYRSELKPAVSENKGGMTLHDLFAYLEQENGKQGLRRFFDEVCVARPGLLDALQKHRLLCAYSLNLQQKCAIHFPQTVETVAD